MCWAKRDLRLGQNSTIIGFSDTEETAFTVSAGEMCAWQQAGNDRSLVHGDNSDRLFRQDAQRPSDARDRQAYHAGIKHDQNHCAQNSDERLAVR